MFIFSQNRLFEHSILAHIAFGAICFACVLAVWAYENQNMVKSYIHRRRQSLWMCAECETKPNQSKNNVRSERSLDKEKKEQNFEKCFLIDFRSNLNENRNETPAKYLFLNV